MNEMDTRFANQYNIQWFPGHMTKTLLILHIRPGFEKEKRDNKLSLFSRFQIGDDQISLLTLAALPVRPRR